MVLTAAVVLDLSSSFTDMQLHSVALRPSGSSLHPLSADSTRLNALFATLEACKRYLDTVITLPLSEYHLISFIEWMRLPSIIMTLARLCMPSTRSCPSGPLSGLALLPDAESDYSQQARWFPCRLLVRDENDYGAYQSLVSP
jgi:hypothetical protein